MVAVGPRITVALGADADQFNRALRTAEDRLRRFNQAAAADGLAGLSAQSTRSTTSLAGLAGAIGVANVGLDRLVNLSTRLIAETVRLDASNVGLENRLRVVTDTEERAGLVRSELVGIALDLRTSVESVTNVYGRLAFATDIGDRRLIQITDTLIRAGVAGGSSVMELNAGLVQLAQGFAANRFQGDELRSVLEGLPGVTRVLVTGLRELSDAGDIDFEISGIGDIREAAAEGRLTADILVRAFEQGRDAAVELGEQIEFSIIQSLAASRTAALEFLDAVENQTGIFAAASGGISELTTRYTNLANNIDRIRGVSDLIPIGIRIFFEGPEFLTEAFETGEIPEAEIRLPEVEVSTERAGEILTAAGRSLLDSFRESERNARAIERIFNRVARRGVGRLNIDIGPPEPAAGAGLDDIEVSTAAAERALRRFGRDALARLREEDFAEQALQAARLQRLQVFGSAALRAIDATIAGIESWEDAARVATRIIADLLLAAASSSNGFAGFFGGAQQFGGPITFSGSYVVGDRGPETVFLPAGSNVRPADGGNGDTIIFNLDGDRRAGENLAMIEQRAIPQLNRIIDARIEYRQRRRA